MRFLPLLLLSACLNPPELPVRISSVNGITGRALAYPVLDVEPGADLALTVEHNAGRNAEVWWAWAPPGWAFAPDATEGVWHVPDDFRGCASVGLFVRKPHNTAPRTDELTVSFASEGWRQWCAHTPPGRWTRDAWGEPLDTGWY